jgi:hypothetical protein
MCRQALPARRRIHVSFPLRRLAGVVTTALLGLMLVGAGVAQASPPKWVMDVTKLPPTVAAGGNAGYFVKITNNGPSNINTLFLTTEETTVPAYVSLPSQGSCDLSGRLNCAFGTLTATHSVTVTVAYTVGTSNFGITFRGSTSGLTTSDGGTSRGDYLYSNPKVTTTTVSNSQNFGGGFVIGSTTVQDIQTVGRNNPQATLVNSPEALVPVTVEDGITTGIACNDSHCANSFGEWSRLNVNGGQPYGTPFKVVLTLYGGLVPGGTATSDIVLLHTLDDGTTTDVLTQNCNFVGTSQVPTNECIQVSKVGSNYQIIAWLFKNGSLKGAI